MNDAGARLFLRRDVADAVFAQLSPGSYPDEDTLPWERAERRRAQKTLARAALVCRALSEPALDVLWRVVDDIVHLISTLPSYVKSAKLSTAGEAYYTFNRDITPKEWVRFQSLAIRVHELRVTSDANWDNSTWIILSRWCPRGPLCPRLKRLLNFHISSYVSGPAKMMLMSPNLQHIQLSMRGLEKSPPEVSDLILGELQPVFQRVESLSIDLQSGKDDPPRAVEFWQLAHLRSLRVLHKVKLTPDLLRSLTTFPSLCSLSLNIQEIDLGESEDTKLELSSGFPELRDLGVGGKLADTAIFLENTSPPELESLTITISQNIVDDLSVDDRRQQLDSVYSKFPRSLHRLTVIIENGSVSDPDLIPSAADLIEPLHWLPSLRRLTFRADIYIPIKDDDLRALEGLWPDLTGFEFTFTKRGLDKMDEDSISWTDSIPAVPTVIAFAKAHPQLRRLTLPYVDLASVPGISEVPMPNHGLELLTIHFLKPKLSLHRLGLAVDRLFPHLDLPENLGDCKRRGDELNAFLFALQAGRRGAHRDV
ncbi:hypothetical protein BD311DRAFT_770639 [Dichomitus squalens]|uniref:F-box domain-containing protein n=1 Tax=Dichomitus squalens TaxID=114155 RepID=A0A4Q9M5S5_9APHY|nr:hypothetical protein BD311DRAFT_770639 [Dichomitus squalens]